MKSLKVLLLAVALLLAFGLVSCDLIDSLLPTPDNDGDELLDFGDWENWGVDDWATGEYEEFDPLSRYNQIDWSKNYPGLASGISYDLSGKMQFLASKHVQVYQAESAVLSGVANTNQGGYYVGSLDDSYVTFTITAEEECDVLLVANFAVDKASESGYRFDEIFTLTHNGNDVDSTDCWVLPTHDWFTFKENSIGELHLAKGVNTIQFYSSIGRVNFDYIKLVPKGELSEEPLDVYVYDYTPGVVIQAEGTNFSNASTQTTGSGRVVVAQIVDGCSIKINLRSEGAHTVELIMEALIRVEGEYSAKASDRFTIKVNGETIDISGITLNGVVDNPDSTRWWNKTYTVNSFGEINLKDGMNTIEIIPSIEMNIDFFKFDVKKAVTDIILEAEDAVGENVAPEGGATGTVVGTRKGSKMTFTFNSDSAREAEFYINAVAAVYDGYPANADGRLSVVVNGTEIDISGGSFEGLDNPNQWWKSTYTDFLLGKINLVEGENTIEVSLITTGTYGEMNIDYFFIR